MDTGARQRGLIHMLAHSSLINSQTLFFYTVVFILFLAKQHLLAPGVVTLKGHDKPTKREKVFHVCEGRSSVLILDINMDKMNQNKGIHIFYQYRLRKSHPIQNVANCIITNV